VRPSETLADVANKFAETNYDELPVVGNTDESRLLGIVSRRQLNNAYIRRVMHYDQAAKAEHAPVGASQKVRK
jgi:predicted transcriptional regulator